VPQDRAARKGRENAPRLIKRGAHSRRKPMIVQGDARKLPLRTESVQCVATSPPYFQLRDYACGDREIGSEDTPEEYVANLVEVFREVRRVLRKDGVLWLVWSYPASVDGEGLR